MKYLNAFFVFSLLLSITLNGLILSFIMISKEETTHFRLNNNSATDIFTRFAKMRNRPTWQENVTSGGINQFLKGQLYWTSDIIEVNVVESLFNQFLINETKNTIKIDSEFSLDKSSLENFSGDYYFHNTYEELTTDLIELNETFPMLVELFSLNKEFNHPLTLNGHDIWCLRITNELTGFNKPEVLYIGCHHGNEIVTVETAFWYGHWLLDKYDENEQVSYLVDNREIYIVPCLNPDGRYALPTHRGNGNDFDLNRDYDYAPESRNNGPFSEIETKCIRDLSEEHQFIISIDWHSGFSGIFFPWGIYFREAQICPDQQSYIQIANKMSEYAGPYGEGFYYHYNAGPTNGSWRDWAYASRVEYGNGYTEDPDGYKAGGQLSFIIEVTLGKGGVFEEELGGTLKDGWVSKNIRLALVVTDLAAPYIRFIEKPPEVVLKNSKSFFAWQINGCLSIDETVLEWSNSTELNTFKPIDNQILSGKSGWYGETFSMNIIFPETPGKYFYRVRAKVDSFSNISSVTTATNTPFTETEPYTILSSETKSFRTPQQNILLIIFMLMVLIVIYRRKSRR
ncbi:MAG: M14 family zinc carboxypeptidase [Candidatus Hodarchaeota archaeon]